MATDGSRDNERGTLALGAGIVAGLATALIFGGIFWAQGTGTETVDEASRNDGAVPVAELSAGSCVTLDREAPFGVSVVECSVPHDAEITNVLDYADDNPVYPTGSVLSQWASAECEAATESYIDADILDTTLTETMLVPTELAWEAGDRTIACYVADFSGQLLETSVAGKGNELPRSEVIIVSRLKVGDCFVPVGDAEPFKLNSNSEVLLVDCASPFAGMVFGRDLLDAGPNTDFPGTDDLKAITGDRCSQKFKEHFGVDSDGFNYHYFRPSKQSWDANDRSIMCSILDDEPIVGGFVAAEYELFFDVAAGVCFNLGPEERHDSIWINDMVLPVDCSVPHAGQMIGSGLLDGGVESNAKAIKEAANNECEAAYTSFMGFAPSESKFDAFPFWYPSETDWSNGDRRYACAFVGPEPRTDSLQGQT